MANFQSKQPSSRAGNVIRIPYTSAAASSAGFGGSTYQVRIISDGPCNVLIFSTTDTVSTSNSSVGFFLAGDGVAEYMTVTPGQKVSVVSAATDGVVASTNGTLWVTEMS